MYLGRLGPLGPIFPSTLAVTMFSICSCEDEMHTRTETVAALRQSLTTHSLNKGCSSTVRLGHPDADRILNGGLKIGALHEIYPRDFLHSGSACGFAAAIASLASAGKTVAWLATDFGLLEFGAPHANGFFEFGIDPRRLLLVRVAKNEEALRAASDILTCAGIGALVIELPGVMKSLDLNASRRLSLAATQRGISSILLRHGAKPVASAAETRWLVQASACLPHDWGAPRFDVELIRNRHGGLGHWEMEWDYENGFFRKPNADYIASHHGDLAATASDRPFATENSLTRAI